MGGDARGRHGFEPRGWTDRARAVQSGWPTNVVIVGTLDTKGEEIGFVHDALEEQEVEVHLVDVGVLDEPEVEPDADAAAVAEADGSTLETLREAGDRGKAIEIMGDDAAVVVSRLHSKGRLDGILRLGGGGNTSVATAMMHALPMGVPELVLSTAAPGDAEPYIGYHDIAIMYSVADIEGLNQLSRTVTSNAALMMVGMVSNGPDVETEEKPTIGIMMFGVTAPCIQRARDWLEVRGYETIVSHATGTNDRAMESLIEGGVIDGMLDVTTTEWADELVSGVLAMRPGRLDAAAERDIPQVVSTDALDMVNFGPRNSILDEFDGRQFHVHNPQITLMQTTPEENAGLGRIIVEKLDAAARSTTLALPLGGISMLDAEGEAFYDPEADDTLFDVLREHPDDDVKPIQSPANINDDELTLTLAEIIDRRMRAAA